MRRSNSISLARAVLVTGIAAVALTVLSACGANSGSEYSTVNAVIAALNAGGVPCVEPAPFGETVPGSQTISCHGSDKPTGGLDQLSWDIRIYFVSVYTDQASKDALAADAAKCQKGTGTGTNVVVQGANWRIGGGLSALPLVQPQAVADALKGTILNCPDSATAASTDAATQSASESDISVGLALSDPDSARVLASDPTTKPEILNQLVTNYKDPSWQAFDVVAFVASNPSATPQLLDDIVTSMTDVASYDTIEAMDAFAICSALKAVATNPKSSMTSLNSLTTNHDLPGCQAPALAKQALASRGSS